MHPAQAHKNTANERKIMAWINERMSAKFRARHHGKAFLKPSLKTIFLASALIAQMSFASLAADATFTPAPDMPKPMPDGTYYHWTEQEQLRAYPNLDKIYPSNVIKRGTKVAPLPKAPQELSVSYKVGAETWDTDRFMKENMTAGLIVLSKGQIVLERYAHGYSANQKWTSFSVAKSFTSTLLGAALKDGFIKNVDEPVTNYLPTLKGSVYEGVTIRHILNMTSGVKWNEAYRDRESDIVKMRSEPAVPGAEPFVTYMGRLTREAAPGTKFVYKTGETHLIGAIVRAATKKTLSGYLSEKVWVPYGMEHDGYWLMDHGGYEFGGSSISASTRDYARFAYFFMHGAKVDGQSIVPDTWIKDATTPSAATRNAEGGGYGYQWWINSPTEYRGVGIFGQQMLINPERDLVVIMQSAWPAPGDAERNKRASAYVEQVKAALDKTGKR